MSEIEVFEEFAFLDDLTPVMRRYRFTLYESGELEWRQLSQVEQGEYETAVQADIGTKHLVFAKVEVKRLFMQIAVYENEMLKHTKHIGNHNAPCSCTDCALTLGKIMNLEAILRGLSVVKPGWNIGVERT